MSTEGNKDLPTLGDKFLLLQQRAGNSSQLTESCLEVSFLCLQTATDFCISAGFSIADFGANVPWKQTFGQVIKSCEHFMTVMAGTALCYLTISFSHCVKCLHFPALPGIMSVIVTDIFWNLSLWTFFCAFSFFFILFCWNECIQHSPMLGLSLMISCTKKSKPRRCKYLKGHPCHVLYPNLGKISFTSHTRMFFYDNAFF